MRRVRIGPPVLSALLALGTLAFAAALSRPDPAAYRKEVEDWRAKRIERLRSDSGWLSLVGLFWLERGENPFGSDPGNAIVLPKTAPPIAGTFVLRDDGVHLLPRTNSGIRIAGEPAKEQTVRSDASDEPDVLQIGTISLHVIDRGGRYGIRVKDSNSPTRLAFTEIDAFPIAPAYRVVADFVPYQAPKPITIPTILGTTETMLAPGFVSFTLAGRKHTLEPVLEDPSAGQLFFIFKDATSGKGTYGAGRFLYTELPQHGKVVLDFNRAYNPPCAFTAYATCPLPPKQNVLDVRIEAGEKAYGHH